MEKGNKWALVGTGVGLSVIGGAIIFGRRLGEKIAALSAEQQLAAGYRAARNLGDVIVPEIPVTGPGLVDLAMTTPRTIEQVGDNAELVKAWIETMGSQALDLLASADSWEFVLGASLAIIIAAFVSSTGRER